MIAALQSIGFTSANLDDLFDKGRAPDYVTYLTRRHAQDGGPVQHQYLTLTSYAGALVEACLLVYDQPLNTRAKKRQIPLYANLLRSAEAVLAAVGRTYPPLPNP